MSWGGRRQHMEELFVYPHKYKHILILDQKLFEAMTVMYCGCVCCYFSVGLQCIQRSRFSSFPTTNKKSWLAGFNFTKSQMAVWERKLKFRSGFTHFSAVMLQVVWVPLCPYSSPHFLLMEMVGYIIVVELFAASG